MRLRQKIPENREYGIYMLTKYYAEQGVPHGSIKLLCSTPFLMSVIIRKWDGY